jgi:hypothetical protein
VEISVEQLSNCKAVVSDSDAASKKVSGLYERHERDDLKELRPCKCDDAAMDIWVIECVNHNG